ncbi:MAG: hypothetical protein GKR94_16790 [Gammaproteobacteria bacterium]|nr:hypothetical protein [Gammaproteobacteria bacterium]
MLKAQKSEPEAVTQALDSIGALYHVAIAHQRQAVATSRQTRLSR